MPSPLLTVVTILVIFFDWLNVWLSLKSQYEPLLMDSSSVIVIPNVAVPFHLTCFILRFLSSLILKALRFDMFGTTYVPMIFAFVGTILVLVID